MSDSSLDPDIKEVFAELARQDTDLEKSLGLEPLEPIEPPPPIEPLELLSPDASPEEWQRLAESEASREHKGPDRAAMRRSFEASLVRLKRTLEVRSGSEAVDAANRRVYAAQLAMFRDTEGSSKDPLDFVHSAMVFRESHAAFDALWMARLEHLRTTCDLAMRPKVDKAIAWRQQHADRMRKLHDEADRAFTELRRLREKS